MKSLLQYVHTDKAINFHKDGHMKSHELNKNMQNFSFSQSATLKCDILKTYVMENYFNKNFMVRIKYPKINFDEILLCTFN